VSDKDWTSDFTSNKGRTSSAYFGVNTSPLIANLIPFNNARDFRFGAYGASWWRVKESGKLFRFELGLRIDGDLEDDNHINLLTAGGKVFPFHSRWSYYRSLGLAAYVGSRNRPEDSDSDDAGIGLLASYGLMFHLNEHFVIRSEAALFVGTSDANGPLFTLEPPLNFFLQFRFR